MSIGKYILFLFCTFFFISSFAQDTISKDSTTKLKEVVITGFRQDDPKNTSINIEPYSLQRLNERAPYNLSDALAKLPGISQITTGNSISKPVIRGLYGNRILVLLSGSRFDNQQWQDEHGLGLSQIGIDRIEIIKGPASLLYGSDALGGVINIIEEEDDKSNTHIDFGTGLFSNTLGNLTDIGINKKAGNAAWRLRLGFENHADYSDGNNKRVLNSRNKGYYLKTGLSFKKAHWKQENSYNFSYNQYGFILPDLPDFFNADQRWERGMSGPHHNVMLNLFNSRNTFYFEKSIVKLNLGFQSNLRMEDEGGGEISLDMHLLSALQNLRWEKELGHKTSFVCNQQFTFTKNTNYGKRIIVPDANMLEGNISGYFKFYFHNIILETGLGSNYKSIQSFETGTLNAPGEVIRPFTKNNSAINGMAGAAYNPFEKISLKANAASGFRAPNLAELSSNGLHEGVYRYEVGNPKLKTEQNINSDLSLEFDNKSLFFSVSGFYNRFFNYIYLAHSGEYFYGFPVFHYFQQNATLWGGELYATLNPSNLKSIEWKEGFSITKGKLDNGDNLPFIPACKLTSSIHFEKRYNHKINSLFIEPEFVYVFEQDNPGQFETSTAGYYLLNLSAGATISGHKGDWKIIINGSNLANEKYADHLSRLKYYGLLNQGINFVFSVRKELIW